MRPGRSSLQTKGSPESLCCWKESKTQKGGDRCEIRKQPDETERQRQEKNKDSNTPTRGFTPVLCLHLILLPYILTARWVFWSLFLFCLCVLFLCFSSFQSLCASLHLSLYCFFPYFSLPFIFQSLLVCVCVFLCPYVSLLLFLSFLLLLFILVFISVSRSLSLRLSPSPHVCFSPRVPVCPCRPPFSISPWTSSYHLFPHLSQSRNPFHPVLQHRTCWGGSRGHR